MSRSSLLDRGLADLHGFDEPGPAPGKRALTDRIQRKAVGTPPPAAAAPAPTVDAGNGLSCDQCFVDSILHGPVQRRRSDPGAAGDVRALAARGTAGGGGPLPFLDRIQASFGAHDVRAVQAHTDEAAASASAGMGARAFATGNHVAFAGEPDLHTAAHEAAHVVQQRAGVHLKGGVGEDGDAYEQQADAVADAVVRGESAEPLLDRLAPAGVGAAEDGVQRKPRPKKDPRAEREEAGQAIEAAFNAMHAPRVDVYAPPRYEMSIRNLRTALNGVDSAGKRLDSHVQAALYANALFGLEPAFTRDPDHALLSELKPLLRRTREVLEFNRAQDRVYDKAHADLEQLSPDAPKVEEQRTALQGSVTMLLDASAKAMKGAGALDATTRGSLGDTVHVLNLTLAVLKLGDHKFHENIQKIGDGPFKTVKSLAEAIKVSGDVVKGSIAVFSKVGIVLANALGKADIAASFARVAKVGDTIGKVASAADVIYGGFLLIDPDSTTQERIDGGVKVASGVATLAGATAAGSALGATYAMVKFFASYWGPAAEGLTYAFWKEGAKSLVAQGNTILKAASFVASATDLAEVETNPAQKHQLMQIAVDKVPALAKAVNFTLTDVDNGSQHGIHDPGGYIFVKREFAPIQGLRIDAGTYPNEAVHAAMKVIATMTTLFRNTDQLLKENQRREPADAAARRAKVAGETRAYLADHAYRGHKWTDDFEEAKRGY